MDEVDKILIESLNHLNCSISEDVTTLKDFDPDLVVLAISTCLETITPQPPLPKKVPSSMSDKIKMALNLAQQIKDLGFKGDMGYQTILYCNEVEIRRVLMFLIERLPKEANIPTTIEPTGYVPRIVQQIEDRLKDALGKMWIPSETLNYGTRESFDDIIVNSFGHSCEMDTVKLAVPDSKDLVENELTPEVTKQCSKRQLIPSLLFSDVEFSKGIDWNDKFIPASEKNVILEIMQDVSLNQKSQEYENIKSESEKENNLSTKDSQVMILLHKQKEKQDACILLQEVVEEYNRKLKKVKAENMEEQTALNETLNNVNIRNKTLAVLSNENNIQKLKNLIEKTQNRLVDLTNQWNEVQSPLLEEFNTLKSSASSESVKLEGNRGKLENLRKLYKEMKVDLEEKHVLEQNLIERCKDLNNRNNRAVYTKRILEIVGNIKKQNFDIQKVLSDTRQIQKDINNLTGQVDRSFELSEELIFYDCKQDEAARKAYKLLALLREECNGIFQAVSDLGQAERELRNLDEQVETEKSKEIRIKLEKVQHDLAEIRKEMHLLGQ